MDRRAGRTRWVAACLAAAGLVVVVLGVPRLVWGPPSSPGTAQEARHPREIRFAPAPRLGPIPLRYAPSWLPGGLRETVRDASVSGSPSTSVQRFWVPEGRPDRSGTNPATDVGELRAPYLVFEVEHRPEDPRRTSVLHDRVGEPGGYYGSGGADGYLWDPEPTVHVSLLQHGLGLDRATLYRVARAVRPVGGEFTFPLQVRELPAGLTTWSWDSYVTAVVRPDPPSGGWSGVVDWCLAWELTVDADGPPEAAGPPWVLTVAGHKAWHGVRRLGDGFWRDMVALELRPGTVVTASALRHGDHPVDPDVLARAAASVEVPG